MVPLVISHPLIDSPKNGRDLADLHSEESPAHVSAKMLELDGITTHVLISQVFACSSFAETLDIPQLFRNADPGAVVRLEGLLTRLGISLDSVQDSTDNSSVGWRLCFCVR